MTELEKMRSGEWVDFTVPELQEHIIRTKRLCTQLQTMDIYSPDYGEVMKELIPDFPADATICPPFHCDYGNGIRLGKNVFINYDCIFLDGAYITIGDNVLIGPGCKLMTPVHPTDYVARRKPVEYAKPITIGNDTWLGGGVVVVPGVTIGERCIIAAGSVVVKDIPDDCMAAGNPAVVKKRLA